MNTLLMDFHMHSSFSDGTLTPTELAEKCAQLKVSYAALTDHDSVFGIEEFLSAASERGIKAVSGVELNVEHAHELHMLGYGFDPKNEELCGVFDALAEERLNRARAIVDELGRHGISISYDRVLEIAGDGVVGRPHIAAVLIEAGYCNNSVEAFESFLSRGGPGYVPRRKISEAGALRLIIGAGGIPVLAHPGCIEGEDYPALIKRLKDDGLVGIEAFYPTHTDEQCKYFCELADKFGLIVTTGSDYHGRSYHEKLPGQEKRGIRQVYTNLQKILGNC